MACTFIHSINTDVHGLGTFSVRFKAWTVKIELIKKGLRLLELQAKGVSCATVPVTDWCMFENYIYVPSNMPDILIFTSVYSDVYLNALTVLRICIYIWNRSSLLNPGGPSCASSCMIYDHHNYLITRVRLKFLLDYI